MKKVAGREKVVSQKTSDHHLETRFTRVYSTNLWEDPESISGPGSRMDSAPVIETIDVLTRICYQHQVKSIVDVPCGDLNWVSKFILNVPSVSYFGLDIVQPLIERNLRLYPHIKCDLLDVTSQVPPQADLVVCKDLMIHLNDEDIRQSLASIKASKSKYLLLSNNFGMPNSDLRENLHGDSACRYVDILAEPFNYSSPMWRSDYLGLWKLVDLTNG